MGKFVEAVRSNDVKAPQQRGFNLASWNNAFNSVIDPDADDVALHDSGCWFSEEFNKVRKITDAALTSFRWASPRERRLAIAGYATREWLVLLRYIEQKIRKSSSPGLFIGELDRIQIQSPFGTEIDPQGAVESLVDGLRFPLSCCFEDFAVDAPVGSGTNQHFQNLVRLLFTGQHYHALEQRWLDCVWNDWRVTKRKGDFVFLVPTNEVRERRLALSEFRRSQLMFEATQRASAMWKSQFSEQAHQEFFAKRSAFSVFKKNGRLRIKSAPATRFMERASHFAVFRMMLTPEHVESVLSVRRTEFWGLSISHVLDAYELVSQIPGQLRKIEVQTIERPEDLVSLAPIFSRPELNKAFRQALQISEIQSENLINLMVHPGIVREQLWFRPFVAVTSSELALIPPAIDGINYPRLLERVLAILPNVETELGPHFETFIHWRLTQTLVTSSLKQLVSIGRKGMHFEADGRREQIDLAFALGDKLFICELKSSLFPAEPLEHLNYRQKLDVAAEQAKRKTAFVSAHLQSFLAHSGLRLPSQSCVKAIPMIISSSSLFCGWEWNGVAVCDEWILARFFDPGQLQLLAIQNADGEFTPTQVHKFYNSPSEAVAVVDDYFKHAPQLKIFEPFAFIREHPLPRFDDGDSVKFTIDFVVELPTEALKKRVLSTAKPNVLD